MHYSVPPTILEHCWIGTRTAQPRGFGRSSRVVLTPFLRAHGDARRDWSGAHDGSRGPGDLRIRDGAVDRAGVRRVAAHFGPPAFGGSTPTGADPRAHLHCFSAAQPWRACHASATGGHGLSAPP